tara:strand:- start:302 stop:550 length:249 start_codon:yes stop_codon:yes gene_type:complete
MKECKTKKVILGSEDYVILYKGEPSEPLDVIYHFTSIIEMVNDRGLSLAEGEEVVCMTELSQELQDRYIKDITERNTFKEVK